MILKGGSHCWRWGGLGSLHVFICPFERKDICQGLYCFLADPWLTWVSHSLRGKPMHLESNVWNGSLSAHNLELKPGSLSPRLAKVPLPPPKKKICTSIDEVSNQGRQGTQNGRQAKATVMASVSLCAAMETLQREPWAMWKNVRFRKHQYLKGWLGFCSGGGRVLFWESMVFKWFAACLVQRWEIWGQEGYKIVDVVGKMALECTLFKPFTALLWTYKSPWGC